MSIGMVKYTGEELYLELEYDESFIHPWVKEHVLPNLTGEKIPKDKCRTILRTFIAGKEGNGKEKEKPYLMAYVNQFDAVYWYQLFGSPKEQPFDWIPIDFASILFAYGYSPHSMGKDNFFKELEIDRKKYNSHIALDDARRLAEVYQKFTERIK